jgi:hypothetical protein
MAAVRYVQISQVVDTLAAKIQVEHLSTRMRGVDAIIVKLNALFDEETTHKKEHEQAARKLQVRRRNACETKRLLDLYMLPTHLCC